MLKAYINYPNSLITAHFDPSCGNIQAQQKPKQRYIYINPASISTELANFRAKKFVFAAKKESNDMWLEINFNDTKYELNVLVQICTILGKNYTRFSGVSPKVHC